MSALESAGHIRWIFRRAACRFSELNALDASTRIMASVSGASKTWRIAWTAASQPDICPAHTWSGPAASWMSLLMTAAIAFPMIRRTVSPTPIGLTPGHLSKAMSRQATKADSPLGSTKQEQIRLAVEARESHRSADAVLNDVHMRFQAAASSPEGPAEPSVLRAVLRISCPSILPNKTGWGSIIGVSGVMIDDGFGCCFGGCFFRRMSRTVSEGVPDPLDAIWLSRCSGPPPSSSSISRSAAFTLPSIISLANLRVVCWADLDRFGCCRANWCWIVRPSFSRPPRSPAVQSRKRRSRIRVCSLALDRGWGFWRSRAGMAIAAFKATLSSADPSA